MALRKQSSKRAFERVGASFDSVGFVREIAERLVGHCAVTADSDVLDVACGTGAALLAALARLGPRGFGVGVDLSRAMVAEAMRRLDGSERAMAVVMDAEDLAFPAASFDVATCASAIYMFEKPDVVVRSMARVLRPGGRLGISDFGADDPRWRWYDALLAEMSPGFAELSGGHLGHDGLTATLTAVCGDRVRVMAERLDVVYQDAETWWNAQWNYRGRQYLDTMDTVTLDAYRRRSFDAIEEAREDDERLHWRPEVIYAVATV